MIADEIRRLHIGGVRLTEETVKAEHHGLLAAIGGLFSAIGEARRAAKVPEPAPLGGKRQRWDKPLRERPWSAARMVSLDERWRLLWRRPT